MNNEIKEKIIGALQKVWDERQSLPNQFVVVYKKMADDEVIGYHMSTMCNISKDILEAKRYSSEDPYPQLKIIAENIKHTLNDTDESGMFYILNKHIQEEEFEGLKPEDIYIDAIYLADGTPTQEFRYAIIDPKED